MQRPPQLRKYSSSVILSSTNNHKKDRRRFAEDEAGGILLVRTHAYGWQVDRHLNRNSSRSYTPAMELIVQTQRFQAWITFHVGRHHPYKSLGSRCAIVCSKVFGTRPNGHGNIHAGGHHGSSLRLLHRFEDQGELAAWGRAQRREGSIRGHRGLHGSSVPPLHWRV